ncbi:hypothetical protein AOB57_003175 [Methanosarcina flavescens]|uniref:Uncharacterized protein n=1 Tax=Methanosarcina flavescens TaxID=1715806 RepID=A0A660HPZ3_9EURY|nr:hypothetical protein AOB57_003175 [Methanosarcina flavescens]
MIEISFPVMISPLIQLIEIIIGMIMCFLQNSCIPENSGNWLYRRIVQETRAVEFKQLMETDTDWKSLYKIVS